MSQNSAIEWTEATWNPVRGCTKVSPGCANCYAETFAERWRGVPGHAYEQGFDLRLVPEKLDEPLRRKKPTTYFVNSMSDLFQDGVPDAFIDRVFAVMALARQHTFQVLTKRAERMRAYCCDTATAGRIGFRAGPSVTWPLPNVWLGVSVENQHFADERIPLLLQTPAAVRFISAEPLLEDVKLNRRWLGQGADCAECHVRNVMVDEDGCCQSCGTDAMWHGLDWVIVGGESGPGARPFDLAWARSIVSECKTSGVPVFVKQLGAAPVIVCPSCNGLGSGDTELGTFCGRCHGCHRQSVLTASRKGDDPSEWPEDLRVREMPVRA